MWNIDKYLFLWAENDQGAARLREDTAAKELTVLRGTAWPPCKSQLCLYAHTFYYFF